jgi:hypothetical protein
MKAELFGTSYSVRLDMRDVDSFAERWPCYGERREVEFQFDARNGDLIDGPAESDSTDERGLVALANDACLAGAIALRLDSVAEMRRVYGDPDSVAILLEHVA